MGHQVDMGLFLDEYPWWELGTPHWSMILHEMFLYATNWGWKEVEHMVCQGHQGSVMGQGPQVGPSTMELVGYRMSCKDIWDIYQSVFLLWRLPGLPCCGNEQRKKMIQDICSSLIDRMQRHGYSTTTTEGMEQEEEQWPRLNRWEPYEEALRAAHQKALDTAKGLQNDIERLSQINRGRSQAWSQTHFRNRSRSCSRTQSQSHSQNSPQSRQPQSPEGPPPRRRVIFREPVAESSLERNVEDHMMEPPVSNVETWLEWQAEQLGTPAWWPHLKAIPGVKDPQKHACKIRASFYIPKVRMRASLDQQYTMPPTPKCLSRNAFIPDALSYQDIHQQPTLLMIAYTRGLQYWPEKFNPPRSPDLHPLVGSIVELREAMWELLTFNHWDVVQGLGAIHLGSMSQWPQTTLPNMYWDHLLKDKILWKPPLPPLHLLLRKTWLNVPPCHLEQKEKIDTCL